MATCSFIKPLPEPDRFTGCDGKILSDELLEAQLESSVEREDYEDAVLLRDELNRRKHFRRQLQKLKDTPLTGFIAEIEKVARNDIS